MKPKQVKPSRPRGSSANLRERKLQLQQRDDAFIALVSAKLPPTESELLDLARQHSIPPSIAIELFYKTGFKLRARGLFKRRRPASETETTQQGLAFSVFSQNQGMFRKLAKPFLLRGVPLEMLYDYCLDNTFHAVEYFDETHPSGIKLKAWVFTCWKSAMRTALRDYSVQRTRFRSMEVPRSKDPADRLVHEPVAKTRRPDEILQRSQEFSERFAQRERLHRALFRLPDRMQAVIRRRFGIGTGVSESLRDIGHDLGVTHERVRQIESDALKKLRNLMEQSESR